ncbi:MULTISPECIES: glucose-1-phosphate adenylyltransferase subunit GlgD [Atopobiaceae]|uniref:glucose-1-phosphate adenylyltransferase subunit GlgD n=1 Tax=Atopobiaceae TaxID=1643824 RepID=UPI00034E0D85|nr:MULTISPECIES: glucose-1-phosphate adenylyltransferase subunit GlgD [Atopobiaceae]EPD78611.1 glucose-1-phosphate adenylyltransferase, GlgD subunit [Atopobium sp. oral taxon 199 str. F0494]
MKKTIGLITCNYSSKHTELSNEVRPIASMPFLGRYRLVDFALSNLVNCGIRTVGVIMPFNYRSLIDHIGSGKAWGLDRKTGGLFVLPGSAFGTSRTGARFLLRDLMTNRVYLERSTADYVVYTSANFVYNFDLNKMQEHHIASDADITVLCNEAQGPNVDATAFEVDDEGYVVGMHNSVNHGDVQSLDCFIISRTKLMEMLDWYAATDYLDLFEALRSDYGRVKVQTYFFNGYARGIFDKDSLYYANMDALNPDVAAKLFPDGNIKTKAHDTAPAKFEIGSSVTNSMISAGCRIYGTVTGSVLGRKVIVEPGAVIRDSIVMQSCIVKSGAVIDRAIVDRDNVVQSDTELHGTPEHILIRKKYTE